VKNKCNIYKKTILADQIKFSVLPIVKPLSKTSAIGNKQETVEINGVFKRELYHTT
jgi:hypothetical protein